MTRVELQQTHLRLERAPAAAIEGVRAVRPSRRESGEVAQPARDDAQRREGSEPESDPSRQQQIGRRAADLVEGLRQRRMLETHRPPARSAASAAADDSPPSDAPTATAESTMERSLRGDIVEALTDHEPPSAGRARAARTQALLRSERERSLERLSQQIRHEHAQRYAPDAYREVAAESI